MSRSIEELTKQLKETEENILKAENELIAVDLEIHNIQEQTLHLFQQIQNASNYLESNVSNKYGEENNQSFSSAKIKAIEKFKNLGVQLSDLQSLNKDDVLQCAQQIRILISDTLHPIPVTDIFNSDILQIFPDLLKRDDQPQLQHELVWVLINIFAEDADKIVGVVKYGVIGPLVKLLTSNNDKVRFQSLWALSNIVCEYDPIIFLITSRCRIGRSDVKSSQIIVIFLSN